MASGGKMRVMVAVGMYGTMAVLWGGSKGDGATRVSALDKMVPQPLTV
jgi:hypothetical protein